MLWITEHTLYKKWIHLTQLHSTSEEDDLYDFHVLSINASIDFKYDKVKFSVYWNVVYFMFDERFLTMLS